MNFKIVTPAKLVLWACVLSLACMLLAGDPAVGQSTPAAKASPAQTAFATPEAAASAFIDASEEFDVDSLKAILGPGSDDLIVFGDPMQNKNKAVDFAKLAKEKMSVELSNSKTKATLSVGPEDWPLAIPIVKRSGKWYFDTKAGRKEILARRIGANELDAIAICRGFVEAQKEYAQNIHDNSGINEYAQRIISTPGKRDGLFWKNEDGTAGGPITEAVAKALQEGYSTTNEKPAPFHGYYFKVLKGRGPSAPGGEIDFIINGVAIGGFALAASPAQYGVSGIKSFLVSYEGIVYQKDLGPDSLKTLAAMERYNPDKTWTPTNDGWPDQAGAADTQAAYAK